MTDALDAMSNVLGIVVVGGVITKVADSAFGPRPAAPRPTKKSKSKKSKNSSSTQSYNQRMHEAVFGR
jgi:mannose/fructose/N-acetylgalactosamine-specific phosphotransferase system component IID